MRAKYIYEAFSEKGDPIEDMGIGGHTFNTLKPGALIKLKPEYRNLVALTHNQSGQFTNRTGMLIRHKYCLLVTSIIVHYNSKIKEIHFRRFFDDDEAIRALNEWEKTGILGWRGGTNRMKVSKIQFDRRFNVIERGFDEIKESLDEKFLETSDPIADMQIGKFNPKARKQYLSGICQEIMQGLQNLQEELNIKGIVTPYFSFNGPVKDWKLEVDLRVVSTQGTPKTYFIMWEDEKYIAGLSGSRFIKTEIVILEDAINQIRNLLR